MVTPHELRELIAAYPEWLLIRGSGRSFPLFGSEIEITTSEDKTLLGFLDDGGFHSWRLNEFKYHDGAIELDVAGPFTRKRETLRLVPRESAAALSAAIELARQEKINEIARLVETSFAATKLIRVELNVENGRLGQIIFERDGKRIAALTDLTSAITPESIMSATLMWLEKLGLRNKDPINEALMVAESRQAKALQKLHALLSDRWKAKIAIGEISRKKEPVT